DFEEHAEQKLAKLERWLPRVDEVIVEVAHQETRAAADRYAVQVTVHSGPAILRAEERAADPRAAFDLTVGVLTQQARRHKKRLHDRYHPHIAKDAVAAALVEPVAEEEPEEEYIAGKVVRLKRFDASPMSEEEALAQMDLIGHDFFIFLDAKTDDFALLYRRKDGDYGMLAPKRRGRANE
ncbi:MAG TPA: ribosome-associated translation inhibitor RaiA, partial [Dehalococcoidia bacterium]|nr:ribosome-associated translation inhibitor RaiA [Dehalococcoidia bacterium]